jgi:predicted nuclease with TOPRIM domain
MSKKKRSKRNVEVDDASYRGKQIVFRKKPSKRVKSKKARTRVQKKALKKSKPKVTRTTKKEIEKKDDYSVKYNSIKSRLTSLSIRTKNLPSRIDQFDLKVNNISNRIKNIRQDNYYSQTNLESEYKNLSKNWNTVHSSVLNSNYNQVNTALQRQNDIENRLNLSKTPLEIDQIETQLSDFTHSIAMMENSLNNQLQEHQNRYNSINNDLILIENTLAQLENSSIDWKNKEYPILAIKAKDLTHDKQGVLTLTNFRILFEEVKEVILRKSFFITTEKKTVKEVTLDQPIGAVKVIEKGRVGFLKGAGLFLRFKPQTGLEELKLDTSGNDDEKVIHFYNYIITGEAQKELIPILDEASDSSVPVNCPHCSAPYSEEILLGQTSIKCLYCGTVIKL